MSLAGFTDSEVMEKAIDECFGRDEILTYDNIESAIVPLSSIYEEVEMKLLQKKFEEKLDINEETKGEETNDSIAPLGNGEIE